MYLNGFPNRVRVCRKENTDFLANQYQRSGDISVWRWKTSKEKLATTKWKDGPYDPHEPFQEINVHSGVCSALAWHPREARFVSSATDKKVIFHSFNESSSKFEQFVASNDCRTQQIIGADWIGPNSTQIFTISKDGKIYMWDEKVHNIAPPLVVIYNQFTFTILGINSWICLFVRFWCQKNVSKPIHSLAVDQKRPNFVLLGLESSIELLDTRMLQKTLSTFKFDGDVKKVEWIYDSSEPNRNFFTACSNNQIAIFNSNNVEQKFVHYGHL